MTALEFFTLTAYLQAVNVDYVDAGEAPDIQPISCTVEFIPRIPSGQLIWASGLTPKSGVALSTIKARTDTDGILRTIQNAPVNEKQTVTVNGAPTSYKLSLDGTNKTSTIAGSAASTALDTALEALAAVGAGNVTVAGPTGSPPVYTVSFVGDLAATNVGQLVSSDLVGGTTPSVVVNTIQTGSLMAGVQLVANTDVLNLGDYNPATDKGGLVYDVRITNAVWNKQDQTVSPFAFVCDPDWAGTTVDLADIDKIPPRAGI